AQGRAQKAREAPAPAQPQTWQVALMGMLAWVIMGLAIWHFTIFLPDRFWGGIVGAFVGSLVGAIVVGLIIYGVRVSELRVPGEKATDIGEVPSHGARSVPARGGLAARDAGVASRVRTASGARARRERSSGAGAGAARPGGGCARAQLPRRLRAAPRERVRGHRCGGGPDPGARSPRPADHGPWRLRRGRHMRDGGARARAANAWGRCRLLPAR